MTAVLRPIKWALSYDNGEEIALGDELVKIVDNKKYLQLKATDQSLIRLILGRPIPKNASISTSEFLNDIKKKRNIACGLDLVADEPDAIDALFGGQPNKRRKKPRYMCRIPAEQEVTIDGMRMLAPFRKICNVWLRIEQSEIAKLVQEIRKEGLVSEKRPYTKSGKFKKDAAAANGEAADAAHDDGEKDDAAADDESADADHVEADS
jgi:hypothetical protein